MGIRLFGEGLNKETILLEDFKERINSEHNFVIIVVKIKDGIVDNIDYHNIYNEIPGLDYAQLSLANIKKTVYGNSKDYYYEIIPLHNINGIRGPEKHTFINAYKGI